MTRLLVLAALLALPASRAFAEGDDEQTTLALAAPAIPAAAGASFDLPPERPEVTVRLRDGQTMKGRLVRDDGSSAELELPTGGRVTLPSDSIAAIERVPAEASPAAAPPSAPRFTGDPNRTRYLYGPSAMMLRQGEMTFSQKELFFSSFAYGLSDNVSVQVGSVVPLLFVPGAQNVILAAKFGGSLTDHLHLAAGAQTFVFQGVMAGLAFGTATLGDANAHLTLTVGRPFALTAGSQGIGEAIVTASGNLRLAEGFAVVTENWFILSSQFPTSLHGLASRLMFDRFAVDLGFVMPQVNGFVSPIPVPWIDFTVNIG